MQFSKVKPVQPIANSVEDREAPVAIVPKPTDSKVKGYVLSKIGATERFGALLPTATAPQVVIRLSTALALTDDGSQKWQIEALKPKKESKKVLLRRIAGKEVPIGLRRMDPLWSNLMNSLMQFLVYLPGFVDLFYYAPRRFHCFLEFIEQYLTDQGESRPVSSANSAVLIRFLMKQLSGHLFNIPSQADLFEILSAFAKALHVPEGDSAILRPERQVCISAKESFEDAVKKRGESGQPEILVSVRGGAPQDVCQIIAKQFFTRDWICYDLHAFIEVRPNGALLSSFFSYIKVDGGWYQCEDERVAPLRSNSLQIPLSRSALLYYKKIDPTRDSR